MRFNHLLSCAFGVALVAPAFAQTDLLPIWQRTSEVALPEQNSALTYVSKYESFRVDFNLLQRRLSAVPRQDVGAITTGSIFEMPTPNGKVQRFKIAESPIMTPALAAKIDIKTYRFQGIDDPTAVGRLDIGINGFHATVLSPNGSYVIDPMTIGEKSRYVTYFRRDNYRPKSEFACYTDSLESVKNVGRTGLRSMAPGGDLKTYRLAIKSTGEYTTFFGGTAALGQAAAVTSINRINAVYEVDLAIRLNIVNNVAYTNAGTDPYTNNNGVSMLSQNQTTCDAAPGNANYDIGHVFSTGGGGVAGLAVVGITGQKARGVTGSPAPVGDAFDIDYVAHEMGHQFGANHTFNSVAGSCAGGNRSAAHAYEPGSASTIMGYAGICGAENLQPNSDPYMHWDSMTAIWAWRNNGSSGGTAVGNGNTPPTANAGSDYTIPQGTPYKLIASGADANGDAISFCWEQADLGTSTNAPANVSTGPLVRSLNPTTNPTRFIPKLTTVMANATDNYEKLPNTNRNLNYRVTVRDNRSGGGAYATDNTTLTVLGTAFSVTSPNTAVNLAGGSNHTVTWTVGGGSVATHVNILLSTNGGASYGTGGTTVLLANTPNDGSESVTLPNINSTTCRVIVEPVGNIFYDMSNVNFTITSSAVPTITSISPSSALRNSGAFTLTVNGTNFVNGTSVVRWNGSNLSTTFVNSGQVTAAVPASNLTAAGTFPITVANGASVSGSTNFTVNNPAPAITTLSPSSVTAASGGFTLTVNGSGFVSDSVVRWNGTNLTTTFVNSGQVTAAVPAGNVALVGTFPITVVNAAPGGGTSSAVNFTVNPILLSPSAASWIIGVSPTGSVADLVSSNDVRMETLPNVTGARTTPVAELEFSATAPATTASQLALSVEASATVGSVPQKIEVYNYSTSSWTLVSDTTATLTDSTYNLTIPNPAQHISGSGTVRARVRFFAPTADASRTWFSRVDFARWTINP